MWRVRGEAWHRGGHHVGFGQNPSVSCKEPCPCPERVWFAMVFLKLKHEQTLKWVNGRPKSLHTSPYSWCKACTEESCLSERHVCCAVDSKDHSGSFHSVFEQRGRGWLEGLAKEPNWIPWQLLACSLEANSGLPQSLGSTTSRWNHPDWKSKWSCPKANQISALFHFLFWVVS